MAFLTTLTLSLIFVTAAAANDESVVTIPLDQIWALDMPGTRDINEYDFNHDDPRIKGRDRLAEGRGITGQLRSKLWLKPLKQEALPAFILRQNGPKRLLQMLRVAGSTVNDKDSITRARFEKLSDRFLTPRNGFRFTLCFFSHPSVYRVELVKIERRGLEIDIQYRFVPRYSAENSAHWALIPLGELPAGDYHVKIIKLPMAQEFLDAGFQPVSKETAKRIVCQPLDFHVRYAPVEEKVAVKEEAGGETVVIPLDQIWALDMPGTIPMNEGLKAGKYISEEGPLLRDVRWHFHMLRRRPGSKIPEAGFVVNGNGIRMEAMRKAHAVLTKNEKIQDSFVEGQELSLVFYNYPSTWYAYIHDVVRQGNKIKIRYEFVPHELSKTTNHFALIPLKNLTEGEYQVTIERLPLEQQHVEEGWKSLPPRPDRLVCESFMFSIKNEINN